MAGEDGVGVPWDTLSDDEVEEFAGWSDAEVAVELGWRAEGPDDKIRWYGLAAELGDPVAMFNLGVVLLELGERQRSVTWFERAAEAGNAGASGQLGNFAFQDGDMATARMHYERAVAGGDLPSHVDLAQLVRRDDGARACDLAETAALLGHTPAFTLRGLYASALLVLPGWLATLPDPLGWPTVHAWLSAAVDRGDDDARFHLGRRLIFIDPAAAEQLLSSLGGDLRTSAAADLASGRMAWMRRQHRLRRHLPLLWAGWPWNRPPNPPVPATVNTEDVDEGTLLFVRGVQTERIDRPGAILAYERAAARGHRGATRRLGQLLWWSEPDRARQLIDRAARQRDPHARWWRMYMRQFELSRALFWPLSPMLIADPDLRLHLLLIAPTNIRGSSWRVDHSSVYAMRDAVLSREPHPFGGETIGDFPTLHEARQARDRTAAAIAEHGRP